MRMISFSKSTPRGYSDACIFKLIKTDYPSITCINYGIDYPIPILIFVVGLIYAPIAPVILPFCTIFFGIGYFVYKHQILFVHIPRYESRGIATTLVINRCLFGLIMMQLGMMTVLAFRAGEGAKLGRGGWVVLGWSGLVFLLLI
jgi:hypothetical protein